MTERSRFWDGIATGDATVAPYDAASEFAGVLTSLMDADRYANRGGIIFKYGNELFPTIGAGKVTIGTGRALVAGTWYENDAALDVAIATPGVSTRVDVIVLRKIWAAQTVRITRVAGTEGAGTPAITQVDTVMWDVPIATVQITTGAVITITSYDGLKLPLPANIQRPISRAWKTAYQALTVSVYATISWDGGVNIGGDTIWSSGAPTRFTAQRPGYYRVDVRCQFNTSVASTRLLILRKNGGGTQYVLDQGDAVNGGNFMLKGDALIKLEYGDYIEFQVYYGSGASPQNLDFGGTGAETDVGHPMATVEYIGPY